MRNLVLIPCHRRPEMLAATLRCIERARGAADQRYYISIDRGGDPLLDEVIATFKHLPATTVLRRRHMYAGTSYNILEGLRELSREATRSHDVEFVYLLEDDVFIAQDFFEYHEDAHDLDSEAVFVSGCRNQNIDPRRVPAVDDPALVYRHVSYQNIGSSIATWFLPLILDHAVKSYYDAPISYCEMKLPDTGLPAGAAAEDGLVHRLIRQHVRWGIYPIVPRAFHAGFYGFNRREGRRIDGHWRDVSERLLAMTDDQMNERADPAFRDIARCELIRTRQVLKLV